MGRSVHPWLINLECWAAADSRLKDLPYRNREGSTARRRSGAAGGRPAIPPKPAEAQRSSIRVLVAAEGQQQNLEIEPRGPVLDGVKVVFDAIDETRSARRPLTCGQLVRQRLRVTSRDACSP